MKRWFKEPLLHFLVAGGLLFVAYAWLNHSAGGEAPRVVRITAAEVNWLRTMWTRQWQRPPSEPELRGIITDYLKEELLAREARELGLDDNDTVVRRRLAQKLTFLVQDTARLVEVGEDELRRYYDDNREFYQSPALISFTQIFFKTEAAAWQGVEALQTHSATELGDPSLLERSYAQTDEQSVTSLFGRQFAARVFALQAGHWHGPLASPYGFHLVRISERQAARARPFDEVRAQVLDTWYRAQQDKASRQFFAALLKKYDVVVEENIKPLIGPLAEVAR